MESKVLCDKECNKINNIDEVTYEDYMNPEMNSAFAEFYDGDSNVVNENGVDVIVKIANSETNESEEYVVKGKSFGEVLELIYALIWASYDYDDQFFEIRVDENTKWLMVNFLNSVEDNTELDNLSDEILETCFEGVESVKHMANLLRAKFYVQN